MMSHLIRIGSGVRHALVIALSVTLFSVSGVVAAHECAQPHAPGVNTPDNALTKTQTIRAAGAIVGLLAGLATFDYAGTALAAPYLFTPPGLAILSAVAVGALTMGSAILVLDWITRSDSQ